MVHCIYWGGGGGGGGGHSYNFQKNIVFLSLRIVFVIANSAGPDEIPHFIWVMIYFQSTLLGDSGPQSVKQNEYFQR